MPAHNRQFSLTRTAAYVLFAAVWALALLLGLGHALHHHDGSCSLCVTMTTQAKSIETPLAPDSFVPPAVENRELWPSAAKHASTRISSSERLRAPPASR